MLLGLGVLDSFQVAVLARRTDGFVAQKYFIKPQLSVKFESENHPIFGENNLRKKISFVMVFILMAVDVSAGIIEANNASDNGDYKNAFNEYKKLAEEGNPEAEFAIGIMYMEGNGTEKAPSLGFSWTKKAAEKKWPAAQYNLGLMYDNGDGVERNYKKAVELYFKASAQGVTAATIALGSMYVEGHGVERNLVVAYALYKFASFEPNDDATENLLNLSSHLSREEIKAAKNLADKMAKQDDLVKSIGEYLNPKNN